MSAEEMVRADLAAMAEEGYRRFQARLIPTVPPETVLGVRLPLLRRYAATLSATVAADFMAALPHKYYDENMLHACLISQMSNFDEVMAALEAFLPYADNWAVTDSMIPHVLKRGLVRLSASLSVWMASPRAYTVRYAILLRMKFFLGDAFLPAYHRAVAEVAHPDYYVRMMQAWYFATAFEKKYDETLAFLGEGRLSRDVLRKTVSKVNDSRAIPEARKAEIRRAAALALREAE